VESPLNLQDHDFQIAFTAVQVDAAFIAKDDPSQVQWQVSIATTNDSGTTEDEVIVRTHKCEQEELDRFYPFDASYVELTDIVSSHNHWYCLGATAAEGKTIDLSVFKGI
jgi:DUF438 domain-containing protein